MSMGRGKGAYSRSARSGGLAAMIVVAVAYLGGTSACTTRSLGYLENGIRQDGGSKDALAGDPRSGPEAGQAGALGDAGASPGEDGGLTDDGAPTDLGAAGPLPDVPLPLPDTAVGASDAGELDTSADARSTADHAGADVPVVILAQDAHGDGHEDAHEPADGGDAPQVRDVGDVDRLADGDLADPDSAATDVASAGGVDANASPDAKLDGKPESTPGKHTALFVVGAIPLSAADAVIESHLTSTGYTVSSVLDSSVAHPAAVSDDVVLVSRTVTALLLGNALRSTSKPVLVWEAAIYDDMGMVDGSSSGSFGYTSGTPPGITSLVVNPGAGELAAGLSGTVTVVDTPSEMDFGVPNRNAITVASLPDRSTQWAIFAYEAGAQMFGLAAPAKRAAFFPSETSPSEMNANGWLLFEAMMSWLLK